MHGLRYDFRLVPLYEYHMLNISRQWRTTGMCWEHARLSYFFNGVFDDVSSGDDLATLSHPVDTVKCLLLCHGAPLRFEEMDARCRCEIQSSMQLVNGNVS